MYEAVDSYCRECTASSTACLRLHALASSSTERPQTVLGECIRVPALLGSHVVAVARMNSVIQALIIVARLAVTPLVVVLVLVLVQTALVELLLIGVELARGHPV